jgi:hypothetical protein
MPITMQSVQRDELLAYGRKALRHVNRGMKIKDVLLLMTGSTPRLYRAMRLAREADNPGAVPLYAPFVSEATIKARGDRTRPRKSYTTHPTQGDPMPRSMQMFRRLRQRAQLLADGRKALTMLDKGHDIDTVRMVVSGSRARLYRAMSAARSKDELPPAKQGGARRASDIPDSRSDDDDYIDPILL